MKNPLIITIGREYGSGGHQIGQAVAEKLGVEIYTETAAKSLLQDADGKIRPHHAGISRLSM